MDSFFIHISLPIIQCLSKCVPIFSFSHQLVTHTERFSLCFICIQNTSKGSYIVLLWIVVVLLLLSTEHETLKHAVSCTTSESMLLNNFLSLVYKYFECSSGGGPHPAITAIIVDKPRNKMVKMIESRNKIRPPTQPIIFFLTGRTCGDLL